MAFDLKFAIIHGFTKEAKQTYVKNIVKKSVILNNSLEPVLALVQGVAGLLGKPGNILSYGQFDKNMRQGKFPASFNSFVTTPIDAASFVSLSHTAVDELASASESETFSTGGHILVAYYLRDGTAFMLIAMIKQKGGVTLDKDYVPVAVKEIDLSKVHQAARINLTRYEEVTNLPAEQVVEGVEQEDRTYLSFVGQGTHNIASGYFVSALGCTKGISSSRATGNVLSAVRAYFSTDELKQYRTAACNGVVHYLRQRLGLHQNAVLNDLVYAALQSLTGGQDTIIDGLKEYLNSEKSKIPGEFAVHEKTLNKRTVLKGESDTANWTVQFEQGLLGITPNSTIIYDKKKKTLTFTELGGQLIKDIETELTNRA